MTSHAATVTQYLDELPPDRKAALTALRALIHRLAPGVAEAMNYGMPVFGDLCAFASQKHYMALYVCEEDIMERHRARLGKLDCGKCCIRFRRLENLPLDVIASILRDVWERRGPRADSIAANP